MFKRFLLFVALAVSCALGAGAQNVPGLWFTHKKDAVLRQGMVEGDALTFSLPVGTLRKGTYVQFGISLENAGDKAPFSYTVEFFEGGRWTSDPGSTFTTVTSKVRHPSVFLTVHRLAEAVSDTLKVRCRVNSPLAVDGTKLSKDEPDNLTGLKPRSYVGAYLNPLGTRKPKSTKTLLLIGNSFTYYYGEPFMLQEIAFFQGLQLNVAASLKGGQTFRQQCGLQMTQETISRGGYQYAILQGQSQEPAQFASDRAAKRDVLLSYLELCAMVRDYSPGCHIYIENTWGYDGVNAGGFDTVERFLSLLEEGSSALANAAATDRTPVGQAFAAARAAGLDVNLLADDDKHPSLAGAYLKACVTYLVLSGRRFKGSVPSCGLAEEDAKSLRSIAESVVLR